MSVGARYTEEAQGVVILCGLYSGGVNEPLIDVAIRGTYPIPGAISEARWAVVPGQLW